MDSVKVNFQPENMNIYALRGTTVIEAAARAGIIIESPCGGEGTCGKCRVEVLEGEIKPTVLEKKLLGKEELNRGVRLGCQAKMDSPCAIHIPQESRRSAQRILIAGLEGKKEIFQKRRNGYLNM